MTSERDFVDSLIAQWGEQRPALDTSALEVAARVIRVDRFLARSSAEVFSRWDLTEGELSVLAALRRSGPPFTLTPTQLYQGMLLSSGAMTNRIDRLEEQGLVERRRDVEDRRRVLVVLTDAGRSLIDEAMDDHVRNLAATLGALSRDEQDELAALLRKLLVHLEADAGV